MDEEEARETRTDLEMARNVIDRGETPENTIAGRDSCYPQ